MRSHLRRLVLVSITVCAIAYPVVLQAQFVYVNDNNPTPNANSATGYSVVAGPALALLSGSPFATNSTGYAAFPAPVQEVAANTGGSNCLFVSDPFGSSTFPTGDVSAFVISGTGGLTLTGHYFDPTNTSGANKLLPIAVDRRVGFPYFFAAFTGENKIVFFKVGSNCKLFYVSSTLAVGLSGMPVMSMAVSKAGPHVLVVAYGDGSIQSFKIGGGTLTPLSIFNSTGFGTQGGYPESVDIGRNGKFAVFGDRQPGCAEVEVAQIQPSGNLAATVDYGGPAIASGVNLCPGVNSRNIWLSPGTVLGKFYLYITNISSGQVTTARINPGGVVSTAGTCSGGFTNPTTLAPLSWTYAAGLHTITTGGAGGKLAVAEIGAPSSVALLRIQGNSGCTREVSGSPFPDPNSNFTNSGLSSVDVFPSRPY